MDWFKTSADFFLHPKVRRLKDRPFRVLVASWGYAARFNTGGYIADDDLAFLGGKPADAKALEDAGLWNRNGSGWHIHDWEDHQKTAVAYQERMKKDAARKAAARAAGRTTTEDGDTDAS